MISLQTNVISLIAQQNLNMNNSSENKAITALTSGYRINSSGDDAAGLSVANQYRANVAELKQGVLNANEATSVFQTIDGGLNNISQILDRLQTLATESATGTFNGDRNVLNDEYQSLLSEITQQASNVGLAGGGQYNGVNSVFIGGGNNLANGQLNIDLSGTKNQVDAAGLGLATTSVGAGGTELTGNAIRLDAPGATFLSNGGAGATQTFTFNLYNTAGGAQTQTVTLTGAAGPGGGLTEQQVLSSLNSQLTAYGITASVGGDGKLQFGGATPFTVSTATTDAVDQVATTATSTANAGVYSAAGQTTYAPDTTDTLGTGTGETLTFQNGQGTATVQLDSVADASLGAALAAINQQTASLGIYAVANAAGTGISLQSASNFTASTDATAAGTFGVGAGGIVTGAQAIAKPTSTGSVTGNAEAAVTAITAAIADLGLVQGRVGAGENALNYAISLANSQVANYSASDSQIRDADIASEAASLSRTQVLSQASVAAMAQANAEPQLVLKLLQ